VRVEDAGLEETGMEDVVGRSTEEERHVGDASTWEWSECNGN